MVTQKHIRDKARLRWWQRAWLSINEPRIVAVLQCLVYVGFGASGVYALVSPPMTIAGEIGALAMTLLAGLLVFAGLLGSWTALRGIKWLERYAVVSVGLSAGIYAVIIAVLHSTTDGNRLLQLSFVVAVLMYQPIRYVRLADSPYDRVLHPEKS